MGSSRTIPLFRHAITLSFLLLLLNLAASQGLLTRPAFRENAERRVERTWTSSFPAVNWDTLPVFWHAADANGPFNASTLDFIARFPLATIEKFQAQRVEPRNTAAEEKIVAAAKQIKERSSQVKVLFYLNSVMDWDMYTLHSYCEQHKQAMWLFDDSNKPVLLRGQNTFNVTSAAVRQTWINTVLTAKKSGYIDGVFVDRGQEPDSFPNIDAAKMAAWKHGHDLHMSEIQKAMGENMIVISNNRDYPDVNARMMERFFVMDFDQNTPYLDLVTLMHEATYPHLVEVHGEPCTPVVRNATLAAFLVGAGDHAYYACTKGWSVQTGWMTWYDEYSKKLGAPLSNATTISSSSGFCKQDGPSLKSAYRPSVFWNTLLDMTAKHKRWEVSKWIDQYWEENPADTKPILGRRFASGTCVTLDFSSATPTPCISWSDGTWTGSNVCK
eukprot:scpid74102/ scgid35225/ 